jgi:NAD(P)-dependent dehydrogenase (short-subunit alcohol dehydrogenase family)
MDKIVPNVGKLAGRTIFITGASRGIGKAIAVKCAKDGANIVIAAKTAQPHPKLPGTIFTAAKELEEAGGKCLACEVDIRNEEQVSKAVDQAVQKFGGIDILVNNASAIQMTNTSDTAMKKFDLMNGVNMRGTFICSKYCIPHLKNAKNPHILNISPPLNMNSRWFKDHVAYTMAKYGMSMCTLGMAEELKPMGIAVNSLWPRTAIYTAAMQMLGGGNDVKLQCRSPDIMADAAYVILNRDSKTFTGQFVVDDDILKEQGVKDFAPYQYSPDAKLLPDFFLDESMGIDSFRMAQPSSSTESSSSAAASSSSGAGPSGGSVISDPELSQTFTAIQGLINPDLVKSINAVFVFELKDEGPFFLDLKTGSGSTGAGSPQANADVTMTLKKADFIKMFSGQMNPTSAFMTGRLKIKGDLGLAMELEKILKKMKPKL